MSKLLITGGAGKCRQLGVNSVKKISSMLIIMAMFLSLFSGCSAQEDKLKDAGVGESFWREIGNFMLGNNSPDESDIMTDDEVSYEEEEDPPDAMGSIDADDELLVGTWFYTAASGNVGISIMVEFKDDGTFTKAIGSVSGSFYSATSFEGNYEIFGHQVRYYDQKKSTATASSWEELWKIAFTNIKDIPVDDTEASFEVIDRNTLMLDDTEMSRFE